MHPNGYVGPVEPSDVPRYAFMAKAKSGGRWRRHYGHTKKAVEQWRQRQLREFAAHGANETISPAERAVVVESRYEIEQLGASLREVVAAGLDAIWQRQRSAPVAELVQWRLAALERDKRSAQHRRSTRQRLERFAEEFGATAASDVRPAAVADWLERLDLHPRTLSHYRAALSAMFEEGLRRDVLDSNPIARVFRPVANDPRSIGFFAPQEAATLLAAAPEDMMPAIAIGLFAGLRPSEIDRLSWSQIEANGHIRIRESKTGPRLVKMPENLIAWLALADRTQPVMPRPARWQIGKSALCRETGIEWPYNGLRHSCATYWLALTPDLAALAVYLGNSPAVCRDHYLELATREQAEAYFGILPEAAENVVQMTA